MTAQDMLVEARTVAKPCIQLTIRSQDGPLAAVWKGKGLVPVKAPNHEHWLSIDCSKLPGDFADLSLAGVISIYASRKGGKSGRCEHDPSLASVAGGKGETLYARSATSLPSFCQLLRNGTPPIRKWMQDVGCDVAIRFFQCSKEINPIKKAYHELVAVDNPLYQSDCPVFAVLGGWPIEIYEDDWGEQVKDPKARQLAFTYAESEPWVQAWVDADGKFHVRQIIT